MFTRKVSQTYRPSDYLEEPGKRQSRLTGPSPGTAKKYGTRQTRNNSLARSGSLDRVNGSFLPVPNSVSRGRTVTPQRTTVYDSGVKTVPHHNDKKWVAEHTQRISEYLYDAANQGKIANISTDLFTRTGGLRQMSIKQFVAIMNYFLKFVGRFTIGTNHVEDISNVLQKIRYPHQVNKSWLKTPSTQHSFGNIIVLFDFFMNFVPTDTDQDDIQFEFQETSELNITAGMEEFPITMQALDADFQLQLIRNAEDGYFLWDKQRQDEYQALQEQTCDNLIMKCCNVPNYGALQKELVQMHQTLKELEKQLLPIPRNDEKQNTELKEKLSELLERKQLLENESKTIVDNKQQLQAQIQRIEPKIGETEKHLAKMQTILQNQRMSVEQRDKLIDELDEQKHMLQIKERTIRDLQDQYHHKQVLLTRSKKQLTDQIEKYNAHMRDLAMSCKMKNFDELQLPRNVDNNMMNTLLPTLMTLNKDCHSKIKDNLNLKFKLEEEVNELEHKFTAQLEPKNNALETKLSACETLSTELETSIRVERNELDVLECELNELLEQEQIKNHQLHELIKQNQQQFQQLSDENDKYMNDAEEQYNEFANVREENLQKREMELEYYSAEVFKLQNIVENLEKIMLKQDDLTKAQ